MLAKHFTASTEYIEAAAVAARLAGSLIIGGFRQSHQVKSKGPSNLVTEIDLAAEQSIIASLNESFPGIPVVSEEADSPLISKGLCWIVDPLDGTTNYVYGIPFFCVNIALVKDSQLQVAITYDPVHNELFTAGVGLGASLDGKPITASTRENLDAAIIGSDIGYHMESARETLGLFRGLREHVLCLRVLGSAALGIAYVACGRLDIYFHRHLYPWDIASGILLVREAGGHVYNWEWNNARLADKRIIATNGNLSRSFREVLGTKS
jgi:fructose-1,6-bisphosphatase/inositol monophosphatase family enzyme